MDLRTLKNIFRAPSWQLNIIVDQDVLWSNIIVDISRIVYFLEHIENSCTEAFDALLRQLVEISELLEALSIPWHDHIGFKHVIMNDHAHLNGLRQIFVFPKFYEAYSLNLSPKGMMIT